MNRLEESDLSAQATGILESITDSYFELGQSWRITEVNQRARHGQQIMRKIMGKYLRVTGRDVLPEGGESDGGT